MPFAGQTLKPLVRLGKAPGDCWLYLGPTTPDGYGKKQLNGKTVSASAWIWSTLFGPVPAGLVISTTCGTRGCVNPHHLRACTQAQANRAGVGASLLPADVIEIKRAKKGHAFHTAAQLAERHGVSSRLIHDIWGGRAWGRAGARSKVAANG